MRVRVRVRVLARRGAPGVAREEAAQRVKQGGQRGQQPTRHGAAEEGEEDEVVHLLRGRGRGRGRAVGVGVGVGVGLENVTGSPRCKGRTATRRIEGAWLGLGLAVGSGLGLA